jgi:Ca2+-binding RTX toxin-like protein
VGNKGINLLDCGAGDDLIDGGLGADVLMGDGGNDVFRFRIGGANGDTVVDFAGNGAGTGDLLEFVGYGAGATFTNVDAMHWRVNFNGGASFEAITFSNSAMIDSSDYLFV